MRTADMIKSKFWRARDVEGQPPVYLTIADVTEELVGAGRGHKETKCFLWFNEHLKGLQLNKSRVMVLEAAYGPDSNAWVGQRVKLYYDPTVEFGGRPVGGVGIKTPPNVVYRGPAADAGWDSGQTTAGRPPPAVWDEKRQQWIASQPPAAAPPTARPRPPPPVWNDATQQWETVDPGTGEIAAPKHVPPPTISQRVNAGNPPAETTEWGNLPPPRAGTDPEFDDDIPF